MRTIWGPTVSQRWLTHTSYIPTYMWRCLHTVHLWWLLCFSSLLFSSLPSLWMNGAFLFLVPNRWSFVCRHFTTLLLPIILAPLASRLLWSSIQNQEACLSEAPFALLVLMIMGTKYEPPPQDHISLAMAVMPSRRWQSLRRPSETRLTRLWLLQSRSTSLPCSFEQSPTDFLIGLSMMQVRACMGDPKTTRLDQQAVLLAPQWHCLDAQIPKISIGL